MARYRLTRAAETDLDGIWWYSYETWDARQASKYLRQLKKRIERLAEKPRLGRARDDVSPRLLSFREGRHLIFYRADRSGITVLRVLHERMDVPERMLDDVE
mgnify:FL=1